MKAIGVMTCGGPEVLQVEVRHTSNGQRIEAVGFPHQPPTKVHVYPDALSSRPVASTAVPRDAHKQHPCGTQAHWFRAE